MTWHKFCDKVPYTISIQFDANLLSGITQILRNRNMKNRISKHISIKYLGYEDEVTYEKISKIVSILTENYSEYKKQPLEIIGFDIMENENPFFQNILYLRLEPLTYLKELHLKTIYLLAGITDIFETNDLNNFVPHITCEGINDADVVDVLNQDYRKNPPIIIKDWELVLHTSERQYFIV